MTTRHDWIYRVGQLGLFHRPQLFIFEHHISANGNARAADVNLIATLYQ